MVSQMNRSCPDALKQSSCLVNSGLSCLTGTNNAFKFRGERSTSTACLLGDDGSKAETKEVTKQINHCCENALKQYSCLVDSFLSCVADPSSIAEDAEGQTPATQYHLNILQASGVFMPQGTSTKKGYSRLKGGCEEVQAYLRSPKEYVYVKDADTDAQYCNGYLSPRVADYCPRWNSFKKRGALEKASLIMSMGIILKSHAKRLSDKILKSSTEVFGKCDRMHQHMNLKSRRFHTQSELSPKLYRCCGELSYVYCQIQELIRLLNVEHNQYEGRNLAVANELDSAGFIRISINFQYYYDSLMRGLERCCDRVKPSFQSGKIVDLLENIMGGITNLGDKSEATEDRVGSIYLRIASYINKAVSCSFDVDHCDEKMLENNIKSSGEEMGAKVGDNMQKLYEVYGELMYVQHKNSDMKLNGDFCKTVRAILMLLNILNRKIMEPNSSYENVDKPISNASMLVEGHMLPCSVRPQESDEKVGNITFYSTYPSKL